LPRINHNAFEIIIIDTPTTQSAVSIETPNILAPVDPRKIDKIKTIRKRHNEKLCTFFMITPPA
jgi:hypothetical protein